MFGQTPGGVRFEHVVLEDKLLGVGPVVRDFTCVFPPHYILLRTVRRCRVRWIGTAFPTGCGLSDEPVHFPVVDIGRSVGLTMRATAVDVGTVVKRCDAATAETATTPTPMT